MARTSRQWNQRERDYINRYISADFETGLLYWKETSPNGKYKAGTQLNTSLSGPKGAQYLIFAVYWLNPGQRQVNFRVHHVIWYLAHGKQSEKVLDHIDRNKVNNALSNLREVTQSQNCQNQAAKPGKLYGLTLKGVHTSPGRGVWSTIRVNGQSYYLGQYPTEQQAARAYDLASLVLHPYGVRNFPDSDYSESDIARMQDYLTKFLQRKQSRQVTECTT